MQKGRESRRFEEGDLSVAGECRLTANKMAGRRKRLQAGLGSELSAVCEVQCVGGIEDGWLRGACACVGRGAGSEAETYRLVGWLTERGQTIGATRRKQITMQPQSYAAGCVVSASCDAGGPSRRTSCSAGKRARPWAVCAGCLALLATAGLGGGGGDGGGARGGGGARRVGGRGEGLVQARVHAARAQVIKRLRRGQGEGEGVVRWGRWIWRRWHGGAACPACRTRHPRCPVALTISTFT